MDKYKQKVCTLTVSECSRTHQLTTNTQLMLIEHYCKNTVTSKHHAVLRCSKNTLFGGSEQYQPVVWLFLRDSSSLMHKNFQLCVSRRCIMLTYRTWSLLGVNSCPEKAPQVREALGHMSLCRVHRQASLWALWRFPDRLDLVFCVSEFSSHRETHSGLLLPREDFVFFPL